jgi:hypothetical protein
MRSTTNRGNFFGATLERARPTSERGASADRARPSRHSHRASPGRKAARCSAKDRQYWPGRTATLPPERQRCCSPRDPASFRGYTASGWRAVRCPTYRSGRPTEEAARHAAAAWSTTSPYLDATETLGTELALGPQETPLWAKAVLRGPSLTRSDTAIRPNDPVAPPEPRARSRLSRRATKSRLPWRTAPWCTAGPMRLGSNISRTAVRTHSEIHNRGKSGHQTAAESHEPCAR